MIRIAILAGVLARITRKAVDAHGVQDFDLRRHALAGA